MGDKIIIKDIQLIKVNEGKTELYQIDLFNETRNEWYRTFIQKDELEKILRNI